jgi:hypothetical protein
MPRGRSQNPVDAGVGRVGRDIVPHHDLTPIVPLVAAQSAMVSATPGSFASTGLTSPNRPGWAL